MIKEYKRIWKKVLAVDMLMLCVSFSISIVGQMFETIKEVYSLSLSQAGMLLSVQSIGGLTVAIMSLLVIDSFNKKKVIVISGVLICVFLIIIGIKMPLSILFIVFIILGLSTGMVNLLTNAVMIETVPKNPERYINFMHMIFSLGAVLAPILSHAIFLHYGLSGVFFVMGGFALFWALYSVIVFRNDLRKKLVLEKISLKVRYREMIKVLKNPGMKEIGIIAILTSCWQLTAIYYISSLFSGLTGSIADGAYALSVLFLGLMISRLLYTKFATKFSPGLVLAIGSFLGAAVWIASMLASDAQVKIILLGISAFFCGNNFPITFSTSCKLSPKNTAAALGEAFFGYYLALFVYLPIIGAIGESIGLNNALIFAALPLLILVPVAVLLHKKMKTIRAA